MMDTMMDAMVARLRAEEADNTARSAWTFLRSCGVIRPGMHPDQPLGLLWANGGLPLDMAAFALAQALEAPEGEEIPVAPQDTLASAAARWLAR